MFVVDAKSEVKPDVNTTGNGTVINVPVPEGQTGFVVVSVNGTNYTVPIVNGTARLVIPGNATVDKVNVTYLGDLINPKMNVTADTVVYPNNSVVVVELSDNANGTVKVIVDGKSFDANVTDGKATIPISGLDAGVKDAVVEFTSSDINVGNVTQNVRFVVDRAPSSVDVAQNGSDVVVSVNATGNVSVYVNGKEHNVAIIDGKAVLPNVLVVGNNSVVVVYGGNENFTASRDSDVFVVDAKSEVKPDVTEEGNDKFIEIPVPEGQTGFITVTVDGKNITVPIENGTAKVNVTGLDVGDDPIEVTYLGDLINPQMNVTVDDAVYPNDSKAVIDLSDNANGTVKVIVDGKIFTGKAINGKATVDITGLDAGVKDAVVEFTSSDVNVGNVTQKTKFIIDNAPSKVDITQKGDDIIVSVNGEGNVTVYVNGKAYEVPIMDGKATLNDVLTTGNNSVIVVYDGDKNHAPLSSTTNIVLSKSDDYTIKVSAKDIVEGQSEALVIDVSADVGSVIVEVDGVKYYVDINGGKGVLNIPNLSEGTYTAKVTYLGDDNYVGKSDSTTFTVKSKSVPDISVDVDTDKDIITVDVPKDAGGDVSVVVDGKEVPGEVSDGKVIVDISDLAPGNHSVEVIYDGDKYAPYDETTDFEVPKVDDYKFDVDTTVDKDKATITVELPEDVNGVVLVDVDGVGYYVNATNGKATLDLTYPNDGKHTVTVSYPGDDKYGPAKDTTAFDISYKDNTPMEILVPESPVKGNFTAYVVVAKDAKGYITVEVDGKNFTSEINDGVAKFDISGIDDGKHAVKVTYNGDDKHNANTTTAQVEVIKDSIPDVKVSQNGKNIVVDNLPSDAQGNVTIIIGGKELSAPVVNGSANIYCPDLLLGLQNIEVIYEGDNKYSSQNYQKEINIVNAVIITAPVVEKYYSGTERFYVYLEDFYGVKIANASVSITINDVTYNRTTNENGTASIPLNLNSMHYPIFVSFNGNEEFNATTVTSAVLINPTIYGNDVVKVFRNGTQYYALFLDSEGNPLVNTTVTFNIHGVFYNRTTNGTGWAKLNLNLEKGTYILTAINPVTHEQATNSVVVISLIVENHNLFKYYRNDSQFVVKILADDGNPVGAGEKVRFNIHGVLYERSTDENGYAKLSINLPPGDYIITTYYKDCREGDHIHVLPVLYTDNLEMKYNDGSQFVALVLDGQGRPYAGQTVQFNINGVFYDRVTDSDGNARLNVNLQAGQYLITSTYNGVSNSNTISIT